MVAVLCIRERERHIQDHEQILTHLLSPVKGANRTHREGRGYGVPLHAGISQGHK